MNTFRIYEDLRTTLGEDAAKSLAHTLGPMFDELGDTPTRADIQELNATVGRLAVAQDRTETQVAAMTQAQERTETRVAALTQAQERTEAQMVALTKAQERTEAQMAALTQAQQHTETASTSDELKPSSTWMFRRKSTQLTGWFACSSQPCVAVTTSSYSPATRVSSAGTPATYSFDPRFQFTGTV